MARAYLWRVSIACLALVSVACDATTNGGHRTTEIVSFVATPTSIESGDSVVLSWRVENAGQHADPNTFSCSLSRRFEGIPAEAASEVACEGQHDDVPRPPAGATYVRYQINALKRPYDAANPYVTATATVAFDEATSTPTSVAIAGGYGHSLALLEDGTVWAWGSNPYGQLGRGDTTDSRTPVHVVGLSDVTSIAAGRDHSLALRPNGTVWAWGSNWTGQLGDGTTTARSTPVQVPGLSDVSAIAAGTNHSLALRADGTVWAWGENILHGQLGDGTTTDRFTPVQVLVVGDATAIAAGANHSLALRGDGTVLAWGDNGYGQLGDGTTTERLTAVQVLGLGGVSSVAAGRHHSLALRGDGTVFAWGHNAYGQVGDGTGTDRLTPVQIAGLSSVAGVSSAGFHSLALGADGVVRAWGRNAFGQLGDGTISDRLAPVQITGLDDGIDVAAGTEHSLALRADGIVWAWGRNWLGQLGDGSATDRLAPVRVAAP